MPRTYKQSVVYSQCPPARSILQLMHCHPCSISWYNHEAWGCSHQQARLQSIKHKNIYIQWCAPPRKTYNHHYTVEDCRSSSVLFITAPNHPQPFLKSVAQPPTADKISIGPMRSSSCCGVATKAVTNQMHGVLSIPAFQEPWHDRRNGHTYPKMDLTKNTCFTCTISGWN